MKIKTFASLLLSLAVTAAVHAQPGGMGGPMFGGSMIKLFGDNQAFSADLEIHAGAAGGDMATMPGKMAFDSGKSRFEMNVSDAKGGQIPPDAAAHMKEMGMDKTVMISRPDEKMAYLIYPDLSSYATLPLDDPEATKPVSAFKMQTTELGKETVDGHPCVKNKAVVTDESGKTHESTLWNATDLKTFPVKMEMTEQGQTVTLLFKNVKIAKPDAVGFSVPTKFQKYDSLMALMQHEMAKRMGGAGGGGMPPGHP
jgi:hypothetical protein